MDKIVIALDLDGCIAQETGFRGDDIGPPFPWAKEFVESLSKLGTVLIYTCRTSPEVYGIESRWNKRKVQEWLDLNGIVAEIYDGMGKPAAAFYIDNKAIRCNPEEDSVDGAYNEALSQIRSILGLYEETI